MKKSSLPLRRSLSSQPTLPPVDTATRGCSQPAISETHIAFVYAGDLWSASRRDRRPPADGRDDGVESSPAFSPDGRLIAFSAQCEAWMLHRARDGRPAAPDVASGRTSSDFTPDGKAVMFASARAAAVIDNCSPCL
jgi:tricorn protease